MVDQQKFSYPPRGVVERALLQLQSQRHNGTFQRGMKTALMSTPQFWSQDCIWLLRTAQLEFF
jgi:hypothetical protein